MTSQILERKVIKPDSDLSKIALDVLHELAIGPFVEETVEKYKQKQLNRYFLRTMFRNVINHEISTFLIIGSWVATVVTGLTMTILDFCHYLNLISTQNLILFGTTPFSISFFLCTVSLGLIAAVENIPIPKWDVHELDVWKSHNQIPEFVQQTIDDLSERLPPDHFYFTVESFEFEKIPIDPFLVLHSRKFNKYYIEVWNESYQKQRIV